jgi:hypothetical protein
VLSGFVILGIVLLAIAPWRLLVPKMKVSGLVVDEISSQPIGGARVSSGPSAVTAGGDGSFSFQRASVAEWLVVEADGYLPARVVAWPPGNVEVKLEPRTFSITVRDAETGEVVPDASARSPSARTNVVAPGRLEVGPARQNATVSLSAAGYVDASVSYKGDASVETRLQPKLTGTVIDGATGRAVPWAFLTFAGGTVVGQQDGSFELTERPTGPIRVLAPGYRRAEVEMGAGRALEVRLEPFIARGVYLTLYGVADRTLRGNARDLAERTEINTIVIDVKGDRGLMTYRSAVPLADRVGANDEPTVTDVKELIASLKGRGIYTIGRIAVFKDDKLARNGGKAGVDVAVKEGPAGEPWTDGENLGWVDPTRTEVWDYNVALAREAAEKGFDEIQFDYVRFPTDPGAGRTVGAPSYSRFIDESQRVRTITDFLRTARDEVRTAGAFLAVDVYGYAAWNEDDSGIGQQLEALADVADYLCPMIYPSTFLSGLPGRLPYPQVISRPYDVVSESMRLARQRTEGRGAVIRPWLQYFDDYPWQTKKVYGSAEIMAQKKAAFDTGTAGWMMWDPANKYSRGGFGPKN